MRVRRRSFSGDIPPCGREWLGTHDDPVCIDETVRNLDRLPPVGSDQWKTVGRNLLILKDVLTLDRPVMFGPAKDKPVLFAALAWAEVLLTLDQNDFGGLMQQGFYGIRITRPGTFLQSMRASGALR